MSDIAAGLLLGLVGSLHCAAMCGPILLAVSRAAAAPRTSAVARMLTYHTGRVFVYATIGAAMGSAGHGLALAGLGRVLAVVAGVLLLAAATGVTIARPLAAPARVWSAIAVRAAAFAAAVTRARPILGSLTLGLANGLLPCGLLYAAAATAAALGSPLHAVLFMIGFGLGTVPALVGVTLSARVFDLAVRRRVRLLGPAVLALAGVVLIARGVLPTDHARWPVGSAIVLHRH